MTVFSLFTVLSCSKSEADTLKAEFGDDAYYYMGLRSLDNKNTKEAIRQLSVSRKNGSYYISKKSAEVLTQLGSLEQKIEACNYLARNFKDPDSLYIACDNLEREKQYSSIIALTSKLDFQNTPDSIIRIRMTSLYEVKDSLFEEELFKWITTKPASYEQYISFQNYLVYKENQYFEKLQAERLEEERINRRSQEEKKYAPASVQSSQAEKSPEPAEEAPLSEEEMLEAADDGFAAIEIPESEISVQQKIMNFRMIVFSKDYKIALDQADDIIKLCKKNNFDIPYIYSDIGKSYLYGSDDFKNNAQKFDRYAAGLTGEAKYFASFYAARLYGKSGRASDHAISRYKNAIEYATDDDKYDNALWYLLDTQCRTSADDIIESLRKYGSKIKDPSYFDDLFDSLSVSLLRNQRWQSYYDVWQIIDGFASEEIACKYAYIAGRLIEEGLAKGNEGLATRQAVDAFTRVLYGKASTYYKVCALERLNILDNETVKNILLFNGKDEPQETDENAEKLLTGYCAFDLPQKVYSEWKLFRNKVSTDCSELCAKYLQSCGHYNPDYNVESLRIASRTKENINGKIPEDLMKLVYPKYYEKYIHEASVEFQVDENLMYALIRSESFFDASITSKAGANGLTQLMRPTADDEARKLKIDNYNITDPQTNVRMGTHYLSGLISRTDNNSVLLAVFAYNGGLNKVRSWVTDAKNDWSRTGRYSHGSTGISMDLFLETVPFEETREYGRKVIAATAMYKWLYENQQPAETVRLFLSN